MRIVEDVTSRVITQAELAHAVGASLRTIQNWGQGTSTPRGKAATRLIDVQHVVGELRDVYSDEAIQIWLRSRNRNLEGRRPIELLGEGRVDEVIEEVDNIVRGM
ncbi:antitoxin Xre/MbcA/ParS toxin-binding domain-containing protein [Motilibacter rhizosphaerae]|nr:antitoxin Xre/MbcA/ParS toxin-binding domain-containing protein [Motilibacter rhizosphaerae]